MTFSPKPKTHFEQVPLEVVKKIVKLNEPQRVQSSGAVAEENLQIVNSSFDIFQLEPDKTVLWQGLAPTVEDAKALVKELQQRTPSQYLIVSLKTGSKLLIDLDSSSANQTQPSRPAFSN